jgi:hypothetical protein
MQNFYSEPNYACEINIKNFEICSIKRKCRSNTITAIWICFKFSKFSVLIFMLEMEYESGNFNFKMPHVLLKNVMVNIGDLQNNFTRKLWCEGQNLYNIHTYILITVIHFLVKVKNEKHL